MDKLINANFPRKKMSLGRALQHTVTVLRKHLPLKNAALTAAVSAALLIPLSAQSHISTQSHQAAVTSIASLSAIWNNALEDDNAVFSTSHDGFLVKWTEDGLGEHYQISDISVRMVARSPNGTFVAVYETNGANINRVSVWNWKTLSRKYAFRFSDTVTSLAFSSKGNYLICGTASVSGTVFINMSNGSVISRKLTEATGVITMSYTSDTENSLVLYSPTNGALSYYNLRNGASKGKKTAEALLTQPCMFNNLVFFTGIKNNYLYVIQAITGKTIARFPAPNSILINNPQSKDLYYIRTEKRVVQLYKVQNDRNKAVQQPVLLATFSRLKQGEEAVCASRTGDTVYVGTSFGNVYTFEVQENQDPQLLVALTDNMYDHITDIASVGEDFYFLTPKAIFLSSYDNGVVEKKGVNPEHTNLIVYGENVILWSRDTRKPVQLLDIASGKITTLFNPQGTVQQLRLFENTLLDVEGTATVNRYDFASKKFETLYSGAGLQDALLTSPTDLYVAKSNATNPNVPLLYVNCDTKETVPLQTLKGNITYALAFDGEKNANMLYGIIVAAGSNKGLKTSVFAFNLNTRSVSSYLPLNEEDNDAFSFLSYPTLFTNMGKNQVRSYNLSTKREFTYKRSASLPLKVAKNSTRLVILNRDGSISWYNPTLSGILADWYLTTDGQWFEF